MGSPDAYSSSRISGDFDSAQLRQTSQHFSHTSGDFSKRVHTDFYAFIFKHLHGLFIRSQQRRTFHHALPHSRREAIGDAEQNQHGIHAAIRFLVFCLLRALQAMIVGDVNGDRDTARQFHSFRACALRMKRLRLRLCQLRRLCLHACGCNQFQQPHSLPKSGEPLMQLGDSGLKRLEIRSDHLPAGFHKPVNLILNFTRLGFQPLIFCVHP